jgi:FAD/FMN-containing dehydrogenase
VQRVDPSATAFVNRNMKFAPVIAGMWSDRADNDANIRWVREFAEALRPYGAPGGYINFMDGDDQGRIAENYGENYARLAAIKAKYDPQNLFHVNQNIKPA